MERVAFRAMGTDVELLLDAFPSAESDRALARARAELERLEAALSRFRPDSELSALNRFGALRAGRDLVRVTQLALAARARTGGRFDPTVHDALVAAGYDRSFELLANGASTAARAPAACGGRVCVDARTGEIELGEGVRLDLGGIGKGYAVDRACELLAAAGPCLVNAGGDLAVRGGPWPVGVETPQGTLTLELTRGAIATSGTDRRRWTTRGGGEQHHLIDPRTGWPAESDLVQVTVVAGCAVEAEVLAKALFLAGEERALTEADELGAACLLVTADGRVLTAGGLQ
ncbi:MAG TPA: FAD:protein FMN transferase [Gaiellaceae bacterium]|nr:FAD:protein FMN transferase [Gaiellaceae bacterium]